MVPMTKEELQKVEDSAAYGLQLYYTGGNCATLFYPSVRSVREERKDDRNIPKIWRKRVDTDMVSGSMGISASERREKTEQSNVCLFSGRDFAFVL